MSMKKKDFRRRNFDDFSHMAFRKKNLKTFLWWEKTAKYFLYFLLFPLRYFLNAVKLLFITYSITLVLQVWRYVSFELDMKVLNYTALYISVIKVLHIYYCYSCHCRNIRHEKDSNLIILYFPIFSMTFRDFF